MHTRTTVAALLLAAGLLTAGCGGSSHGAGDSPTATTGAAATTTTTSARASTQVKLSTKWDRKLETVSLSATKACQTSGSEECLTALDGSVTTLTAIIDAIGAADADVEYTKTVAEITRLVNAADAFTKDECPGDPNADVDGSPCYGHAMDLTVGLTGLSFVMQTDEANAGAL